MKEIELTQNKIAIVDDDMFEELIKHKWFCYKSNLTYYAARMTPIVNGKRIMIQMHHMIAGYPPKGFITDHRNGNGLFNLKNNLRFITKRQNSQNRKNIVKSSQYPGVSWSKERNKWEAYIRINNKRKHLGRYIDELEAFYAYKTAVETLGETVIDF